MYMQTMILKKSQLEQVGLNLTTRYHSTQCEQTSVQENNWALKIFRDVSTTVTTQLSKIIVDCSF